MQWNELKTPGQLDQLREESKEQSILIFKYSSRCSISQMVFDRLERNWKEKEMTGVKPYFLDLISYRDVSNRIALDFEVEHESPQVLIIENGKSVYNQSHMGIDYGKIRQVLAATG
jgi:bacillithiol system protein YtxJ